MGQIRNIISSIGPSADTAASVRLTTKAAYGSDKPSVGQIRNIISNIGPSAAIAASVRFTLEGK